MNKKNLNDSLKVNVNLSVREMNAIWDALEDEKNLMIMSRFIARTTKSNRIKIYRQVQKKICASLEKVGALEQDEKEV